MPGKQKGALEGLEVEATLKDSRGVLFTDEKLDATFTLRNTLNKRLSGTILVFYGCGPSGLEAKYWEKIPFNLAPEGQPGAVDNKKALDRLVAIQGNGVIALAMPEGNESEVIIVDYDNSRVLRPPSPDTRGFHFLYTFTTMEREFQKRFYERPEKIQNQTRGLTLVMTVLTLAVVGLTVAVLVKG